MSDVGTRLPNKIHLYRIYCNNKISNYAKANVDNTLMSKQNVKMH